MTPAPLCAPKPIIMMTAARGLLVIDQAEPLQVVEQRDDFMWLLGRETRQIQYSMLPIGKQENRPVIAAQTICADDRDQVAYIWCAARETLQVIWVDRPTPGKWPGGGRWRRRRPT